MTTFSELVADLKKENLLDDGIIFSSSKDVTAKVSDFPDSIQLLDVTSPGLFELTEKRELKLPEFSFLHPETVAKTSEENPVKAVLPAPLPQVTFHSTQNFIKYQNRRRRPASKKKGGKYCRSCELFMPFYYLNCRYCHGKLVGDLSYYVLLMFSAVILTMFVLFMLSNKTYN